MESLHLGQPYTIRYSLCDGDIPTKTIAMLPEQQDAKRAVYVYYQFSDCFFFSSSYPPAGL